MARVASGLISCLALVAVLAPASPAAAQLYRRDPPRLELGLGVDFALASADDSFDDLEPPVLFAVSGSVHVLRALALGVVVRAAVSDPDGERIEVLGSAEASWVDEPRLPDPPALRLAGSLELGWVTRTLHGSDFVVDDQGLLVGVAGELGVVVFEDVALALRLQVIAGTHSNDTFDLFAPEVRGGLAIRTLLGR